MALGIFLTPMFPVTCVIVLEKSNVSIGKGGEKLRLTDADRATLGEIGHRLWHKALEDVATAAQARLLLWSRGGSIGQNR